MEASRQRHVRSATSETCPFVIQAPVQDVWGLFGIGVRRRVLFQLTRSTRRSGSCRIETERLAMLSTAGAAASALFTDTPSPHIRAYIGADGRSLVTGRREMTAVLP